MRSFSKSFCVFLAALLALLSIPFAAFAADLPIAGQCGDNLSFELDLSSGTMEVTGVGEMWDYRYTDEDGDHKVDRAYEAYADQIRAVSFGEGVTYIGSDAFAGCANLRSVSFSSTVEMIGNFAFLATGLREIAVPEGVVAVGQQAFSMCNALRYASLPSTITWLDATVFAYDHALEVLDFGLCDPMVFGCCTAGDCPSLTAIDVAQGNAGLSAPEGVLFQREFLWQYPAGKTCASYVVPDGTAVIFMGAFMGTTHLRSVFLPLSVTEFGSIAFLDASVSDLYYAGSEAQWDEIVKPDDLLTLRAGLEPIAVHFNATVAEMEAETEARLQAEALLEWSTTPAEGLPAEPTTAEPVPEPTTAYSDVAAAKPGSTVRAERHMLTDGAPLTEEDVQPATATDAEPLTDLPIVLDEPADARPAEIAAGTPCEPAQTGSPKVAKCDGGDDSQPVVRGDADGDGRLTSADARAALRMAVGLDPYGSAFLRLADADGDGRLTPADARLILRAAVGLVCLA